MHERREESAAQVRREREELAERKMEREEFEEERVRQAHDSMLGPKVLLTDAPEDEAPRGGGGGGGGGGSAIELFGRLFGFRKSVPSTALVPAYRGTTPRYQFTPGQTPRTARGEAPAVRV
jgi:hypothetical protein